MQPRAQGHGEERAAWDVTFYRCRVGVTRRKGLVAFGGRGKNVSHLRRSGRRDVRSRWMGLKSKRDPSSRKALLWMTAKCGLGGRTARLGEEDRLGAGPRIKDLTRRAQRNAGGHGEFGMGGPESKRDPSSRKALLWMTAKYGLGGRTGIWRRSGSNDPTLRIGGEEWGTRKYRSNGNTEGNGKCKSQMAQLKLAATDAKTWSNDLR